jgi:O-antigen/teichoic acid export membrane protein
MSKSTLMPATTAALPSGKLAGNSFYLLVGQAGSTALSIILTAFLGRWLGPAEFGTYYILASMSAFAYVFVDWGQNLYLNRESARRPQEARALLGSALALRATLVFLAALVTALLARLIGYDSKTEALALLAVACGLPVALSQPYGYVFRGRDRMDLDATVTVAGKALTVVATVPALLLGGRLPIVLLMQAVGGAGALLMAVLLARKMRLEAQRPARELLMELLSGGAPIAVFFVALMVQPYIDAIVLSKLVPLVVVGWYGAARTIMGALLAPAAILSNAAFPELSRVSSSVSDLRSALRTTLRPLLGLGALATVGTFLFADVAVGLIYGRSHFDQSVTVLHVFAPFLLLFFIDILFGITITAVGKTREMAVIKALNVVVSTILAILLIPISQVRFGNGGMGLVLAFGSTEILMLTGFLWLLPRGALDHRRALLDFLRAAAAVCGTLAVFWALPSMTSWLAVPACVVVFMVMALASGLLLRADMKELVDLVCGKFRSLRLKAKG